MTPLQRRRRNHKKMDEIRNGIILTKVECSNYSRMPIIDKEGCLIGYNGITLTTENEPDVSTPFHDTWSSSYCHRCGDQIVVGKWHVDNMGWMVCNTCFYVSGCGI